MSNDPQASDPSPPAGASDASPPATSAPIGASSPVEPVGDETVVLPTRTPADAADVFFQPRQVDGPAAEQVPAAVVSIGEDLTAAQLSVPDQPPDRFGELWPVSFAFNHHQVAGSGEDSEPVLRTGADVALLAVFDGMGGAGGTVYDTPEGPRSGAYLSSRVARDVAEQVMVDWLNAGDSNDGDDSNDSSGEQAAELVQRSVQQALQSRLLELRAPTSRLRSRLLRALPTTMAMVAVQHRPGADQTWSCDVLWAGDSRVYALDATGLHQLTVDDIRDQGDAMANLRQDSVVSNAMSADTAYVVNSRRVELSQPVALIAATDGCFGYLPSPMHFEHLLLATLHGADTVTQWSDAVRTAIVAVAGDDASMALAGIGADFDSLKALTAERRRIVQERWVGPLDAANAEVDRLAAELDRARLRQAELSAELWAAYRPDYSRSLPDPGSRS